MNRNYTTIDGRLVSDPDLRYSQRGTAVCKVTIANNWKSGDREDSCFLEVAAFGGWAEGLAQLKKGQEVTVSGRLKTDQWEDKQTGEKRSKLVLLVDQIAPVQRQERPGTPRQADGDGVPF